MKREMEPFNEGHCIYGFGLLFLQFPTTKQVRGVYVHNLYVLHYTSKIIMREMVENLS